MGAVDLGGGKERGPKKGKRKKKRIPVKIDMTPMVDIAFLLLIFFMVTAVFRTPQALEINLPPKDIQIPVAQSNVMTLRVLPGEQIFWGIGENPPELVTIDKLAELLRAESAKNTKLVVLIKIDREAEFKYMVDIIDELDFAKVTRFAMAPLSEEDRKELVPVEAAPPEGQTP